VHPALRSLYRIPLWLRRHGIRGYERVLGIEWIVLTTRGRRTGRPHAVVVDVVGHDARGWYVQPADPHAQWVRNVRADPRITVEVGGRTIDAEAHEITGPEGADVVLRFIRSHPRYARVIVWLVRYVETTDLPDAELHARLRAAVVFALRPSGAV
jgi:deazaflavin-dependent oxidoreductase (nitroreductase family)